MSIIRERLLREAEERAERNWKAGAEAMREAVIAALWERAGREEYGHAKAAVTLDIEAVAALPIPEEPK